MESRKKEIFENSMQKQAKLAKRTLLIVFSILGGVFLTLGLIFGFTIELEFLIFTGAGAFFILLGVILFFAIPEKYNYKKYEARMEKIGYMTNYELKAQTEFLQTQIDELEQRVKELEYQKNK